MYVNKFQEIDGKTYYFDKKGLAAADQWKKINKKYYYFNEKGVLQKNTVVDGYRVDANGVRQEKMKDGWVTKNGNKYGLHKGYGMCECGGTVSATSYDCNKMGSAGIPLPNVTVAVFDLETGNELPYDERGEIRVLTPSHMLYYYKNPQATEAFFWEDPAGNLWSRTGDMGYVDEDGCLYVCGRISDSYTDMSGNTIYLFDVERAILDVDGVKQCKAVASTIEGRITHVCHIALYPGACRNEILEAIETHCAEVLPPSHQPELVKFHDALPVAPSGKLDIPRMQEDADGLLRLNTPRPGKS
jgi:long-chain acyl-CoA synthetase